jgi:putative transposase
MSSEGDRWRKRVRHFDGGSEAHELTFSCFRQQPFLSSDQTCGYMSEAIIRARKTHCFHVWAYVFMPEHVHLLLWPTGQEYSTSRILTAIKLPVSKRALSFVRQNKPEALNHFLTGQKHTPYRFWQAGPGCDRNVTNPRTLKKIVDYFHGNPVRRGLVQTPEEWFWSSARAWQGIEAGPIPIDKESFPFG